MMIAAPLVKPLMTECDRKDVMKPRRSTPTLVYKSATTNDS